MNKLTRRCYNSLENGPLLFKCRRESTFFYLALNKHVLIYFTKKGRLKKNILKDYRITYDMNNDEAKKIALRFCFV
jgi:galactokinase/mevalonate kinase-like predicted kinase